MGISITCAIKSTVANRPHSYIIRKLNFQVMKTCATAHVSALRMHTSERGYRSDRKRIVSRPQTLHCDTISYEK